MLRWIRVTDYHFHVIVFRPVAPILEICPSVSTFCIRWRPRKC